MNADGHAPHHPTEATLRAYALGDLGAAQAEVTEQHALGCARCAAQVRAWRDELVSAIEALPTPDSVPPLRARPEPPRASPSRAHPAVPRGAWPAAAAVAGMLALAGGVWGGSQTSRLAGLRAEQAQVTRWLARSDLRVLTLKDVRREPSGRVLVLPDRRALFVLPEAPPGYVYAAWVARGWQRGDPMQLAQTSRAGVFEVNVGPNDYLCVSLEVRRPGARPTRVLGWTFL
ncbi:hypothetical protein DEIPH_ctg005orf0017 [Deinococcus phoenicis]|uniref:Anti-sigma factor n=1 Tax=Deinococcus phoenicis TaxID=1476583 RepID=A0A016QTM6_9DEIO|nr:hypothetical protein [Deinococcus phoenicis]EYB69465.1 hypothetical protein DEIPH_ctg005orf0017 [Deinococcus phoenicis]